MPTGTINLIKTKTSSSPQLEALEAVLKKISFGGLLALIISSVAVGGLFFYLRAQKEQLEGTKATLTQSITQNTNKEGLLLSIRQRISIIDKIQANKSPAGPLFDILGTVVSPSQLFGLALDDHNEAIVTIHVKSIDDVVTIVDLLLKAVEEKQAKSPKLVSLTLARDGTIEVALSFVTVL